MEHNHFLENLRIIRNIKIILWPVLKHFLPKKKSPLEHDQHTPQNAQSLHVISNSKWSFTPPPATKFISTPLPTLEQLALNKYYIQ